MVRSIEQPKRIRIIKQPIINILTRQVMLEECFCRPDGYASLKEYFSIRDPWLLWQREYHAILQAITHQTSYPMNCNITMMSLPKLLASNELSWNGGIEIVEWGRTSMSMESIQAAIQKLQTRGLSVWADDVTPELLDFWVQTGVPGLKVELQELYDIDFLARLKYTKKPIIIERIETKSDEKFVLESGFHLVQGHLYGKAQ